MPTGLRQTIVLNRIAAAMQVCEDTWDSSLPQRRVEEIVNAVLNELRLLEVPVPLLQAGIFPGLNSQFHFKVWVLQVNKDMALGWGGQSPFPTIALLGDTIMREARHCEQWYRMARLLATERRAKGMLADAREISQRLGINSMAVCQQAAAAPPLTGVEKSEAEEWYESVYGSQSPFRNQMFAATPLKPTDLGTGVNWQQSQNARYQRVLMEEEDAWDTGAELQRLYLAHHWVRVLPGQLTHHPPVRQGISTYQE